MFRPCWVQAVQGEATESMGTVEIKIQCMAYLTDTGLPNTGLPELRLVRRRHVDLMRVASCCC